MNKFTAIMSHIGMPVAIEKTLGPTQELTYLGLLVNFPKQVIGIPLDKRHKCLQLIHHMQQVFISRRKTTVKKIQQLAGSLNFLCQALPAGRPFLASLYRLTRFPNGEKRRAGNHRKLPKETYLDLSMFRFFLDAYAHESLHTVPFLRRLEVDQDDIHLYADAAGAPDKGLGCYYNGQWFQGLWQDTTLFHNGHTPNIALLELLAIVIVFDLWAPHLRGRTITLQSDNTATCNFINNKKGNIPAVMTLLRHLALQCLHFQVNVKAIHIAGNCNINADLISHNLMNEFFSKNPTVQREPQPPLPTLWPPRWTTEEMKKY